MFLSQQKMRNALVLILSALALFGMYFYFQDWLYPSIILMAVCGCLLMVGMLLFNFKWYYIFTIALIPISLEAPLFGSANLSLPSEVLLGISIPAIVFFGKTKVNWRAILKHPITILLFLDLIIQLFASFLGTHLDVSLKRVVIRALFIFGFFFLINSFSDKKLSTKVFLGYCIGLIPVMFYTFSQHFKYNFDPRTAPKICEPFYDDHTIYGACLAFVIPFLLILIVKRKVFKLKKWFWVGLIFLTLLILASEFFALSRAAILSLGVAFGFFVLLLFKIKFRTILIGLGVLISVIFVFRNELYSKIETNQTVSNDGQIGNHFSSVTNVQSDASNLERINRWVCAYRMFEDRPIIGFGPGTYQFEYHKYQTLEHKTRISTTYGDKGNAHSEYLTYLTETGIIGLLVFLASVFVAIYYGMQNHYLVENEYMKLLNLAMLLGLITFFFHGIFNSFIDQSKMAFLYFGALGVIVKINLEIKRTECSPNLDSTKS